MSVVKTQINIDVEVKGSPLTLSDMSQTMKEGIEQYIQSNFCSINSINVTAKEKEIEG